MAFAIYWAIYTRSKLQTYAAQAGVRSAGLPENLPR
jgi:hypothetical protein